MTDWWKKLVVGEGNVIRERSFTNWNTFDASEVVAAKEKEKASKTSGQSAAGTNEDSTPERD
jgi:hypothetical protein